jgi:hypothetical protein
MPGECVCVCERMLILQLHVWRQPACPYLPHPPSRQLGTCVCWPHPPPFPTHMHTHSPPSKLTLLPTLRRVRHMVTSGGPPQHPPPQNPTGTGFHSTGKTMSETLICIASVTNTYYTTTPAHWYSLTSHPQGLPPKCGRHQSRHDKPPHPRPSPFIHSHAHTHTHKHKRAHTRTHTHTFTGPRSKKRVTAIRVS